MKKGQSKYPLLSTISFIVTLIVNYGSALGWFDATQKEISNQYRNFLTPEPFTFSIWGVIYLLVIVFLGYQFYLQHHRRYQENLLDKVNLYFIFSCLFNVLWNILWVNDVIGLSTIFIFLFVIVLGLLCRYLVAHDFSAYNFIIPTTFAVYFGWLFVATPTNIAAFLEKIEWEMWGISEHIWACLIYIFLAILAALILTQIRNPLFNLPVIWAFIGILAMLLNNPPAPVHWGMPIVVGGVIVALVVEAIYFYLKNNKQLLPD